MAVAEKGERDISIQASMPCASHTRRKLRARLLPSVLDSEHDVTETISPTHCPMSVSAGAIDFPRP